MADTSKFFLIESGLSFDDDVVVFSGFIDPSSNLGESAPIGSVYIRTNGQLWQKFGLSDTDWQLVSNEGTSVKVSSDDTTTGYLNDKITVASSLIKSVVPGYPSAQTLNLDLSSTGVIPGTYTLVTVDSKGRVTSALNPTTLSGYGITDAQPLNQNLTALANISAGSPPVGFYTITGAGQSAARFFNGTTNQIDISNNDGILGNPTVKISNNPVIPGSSGIVIPIGTQAQEQNSQDGTIRYDSTLNTFRFKQNGQWLNFGHDLQLYKENPNSPSVLIATGQNSVALGEGATSTGQNSVAIGTSTANADQSVSIGTGARSSSYGQLSFSSRPYSSQGSSQGSEYIYAGQTIAQYPIELFLDNLSQRALFPDDYTAVTFSALVIAQRIDINGELYSAKIDGQLFKGSTNASTIVNTVKSQFGVTYQDMDASIVADTTNGTFNVKVTGKANQTWRWTIRVSAVENIL